MVSIAVEAPDVVTAGTAVVIATITADANGVDPAGANNPPPTSYPPGIEMFKKSNTVSHHDCSFNGS